MHAQGESYILENSPVDRVARLKVTLAHYTSQKR